MKRSDIASDCPEEFDDEFNEFLDDIESRIDEALSYLDIKDLDDLGDIQEAFTILKDLSKDIT